MKIALVHDYLIQYGGGERVLEALCEIFPEAPIFTLLYGEKETFGAFAGKKIHTSFLQKTPFVKKHHRFFPALMPFAVEQFDLSGFDLIISDSASFAKGVITPSKSAHICYCHTPTRFTWDDSQRYIETFGHYRIITKLIPFFMNYIRIWDRHAADRVDYFLANSDFVGRRIAKYYRREAKVLYPPVDAREIAEYAHSNPAGGRAAENHGEKYFLMVGRFLPYKQFDLAIAAFNELGLPLKIVGDGPEKSRLKKIAKPNIEFHDFVIDKKRLFEYYKNCEALIFPQEEDFGITAVEAMAAGKPVIAFRGGGALETVIENKTGIFFDEQTPESLIGAVKKFRPENFGGKLIQKHALKFDKENFKKEIINFVKYGIKGNF